MTRPQMILMYVCLLVLMVVFGTCCGVALNKSLSPAAPKPVPYHLCDLPDGYELSVTDSGDWLNGQLLVPTDSRSADDWAIEVYTLGIAADKGRKMRLDVCMESELMRFCYASASEEPVSKGKQKAKRD